MEEFRSRSYGDGRMEAEVHGSRPPPHSAYDLRCYSASYASSQSQEARGHAPREFNMQHKGQSASSGSSSSSSSSSKGGWSLSDPELQRKKRVASYKAYAMEGKMKGSLRKSFRWLKERCNQVVYGWR